MSKRKKIIIVSVFIVIAMCIAAAAIYIITAMNLLLEADDYRHEVLNHLSANVMGIHSVDYDFLDDSYKSLISKEEYDSLRFDEDIVDVYKLFNTISESRPTTTITTDGYRTDPCAVVDIQGKSFEIYHHIYFDVSVSEGRPKVVRWDIDITEC